GKLSDGEIWYINRHQTRRRRSAWGDAKWHGVRGLARDCGLTCFFRLRQDTGDQMPKSELRIHLMRWKQLPQPHNKSLSVLENNRIQPIVQFIDSPDAMHARMSRFVPDCLYSAHVEGATESSIVNLCDIKGGLFGTLALPDGTYLIEPVKDDFKKPRKASSSRAHIVYKSRSHSFHKYGSPSSSGIITTTPSLTIAAAAAAALYSTNNNSNDYNDDNTDNHNSANGDNHATYHISDEYIESDNNTAYYTTPFVPNIDTIGMFYYEN
ncbi:unnamed protein product, partial [Thelazia callipaeda]|uniref:Pep_M12B_propep domain-containing protein n=1 Tax=Thelazia callipaeda TaxID=103827 RepID=A0A0N5D854_THECL